MGMNRKALSMNEAEMVTGGWDWECFGLGSFVGGTVGGTIVGTLALAASGPVGWCVLGGAAVGAAALGIYAGVEEID